MKHKLCLVDINFSKRAKSGMEKELRDSSPRYSELLEKRRTTSPFNGGAHRSDFAGVVEYLPSNKDKNIKESANILVYLYNRSTILHHLYKSVIDIITSFINDNNITELLIAGEDVERLSINNIDIINDIKNLVNHEITINTTKPVMSSYKFTLSDNVNNSEIE